MRELREINIQDKLTILSESKTSSEGNTVSALVPWIVADEKNRNSRIYPKSLLQREINKAQKAIEEGGFFGTADHPKSGLADLETVSHIVKKLWLDENGKGWAELKILPTTKGKNLMTVIRGGGRLGISARGFGTLDEKTGIVKDDYSLAGIDVVVNPSFEKASFTKADIFESVDLDKSLLKESHEPFDFEKDSKGAKLFEKIASVSYSKDERFSGSLEEWLKEHGDILKAAIMVEESEAIDLADGLRKLGAVQALKKLKREKESPPVTAKDLFFEARIAGMNPVKMAEKINKARSKEAITEREKYLREELRLAGITDLEMAQKMLQKMKKQMESTTPSKPVKKVEPLTEAEKKSLLNREKMLAGGSKTLIK